MKIKHKTHNCFLRYRLMALSVSLLGGILPLAVVEAADIDQLTAERLAIERQVAETREVISAFEGGMIRALAEMRREALLLGLASIDNQLRIARGEARTEVVIPSVTPQPERAEQLLGEIATVSERVEQARREAEAAGGLIRAVALSRLQIEQLALAQLQLAYLQAHYGIAFPVLPTVDVAAPAPPLRQPAADPEAGPRGGVDAALPWADPRYPRIDYSLAPFVRASRAGQRISGWWVIETDRAAIDDSPKITAINYSAYRSNEVGGMTALIARCVEGEPALLFIQDQFLSNNFRTNTLMVHYRIDSRPAIQTAWSALTNNQGAGLFRREAENFIRSVYDAERIFVRVIDNAGRRVEATFDLAGAREAYDQVAEACRFTTLSLSAADYRAIQTLLNAGGFDAGRPDGQWGAGSQRALRLFQERTGLPTTGIPDRQTLDALGLPSR